MNTNSFLVLFLVTFGIILFITKSGVNEIEFKNLINKIRVENFKVEQNKEILKTIKVTISKIITEEKEKDLEILLEKEKTFYENHIFERTKKIEELEKKIRILKKELLHFKRKTFKSEFQETVDVLKIEYRNLMSNSKPFFHESRYPEYNPICLSSDIELQKKETIDAFKKCKYSKNRAGIFEDFNDGFSIPFSKSFKIFLEFVYCQIPFSFTRYGDGEFLLANGWKVDETFQAYSRDKWTWKKGKGVISYDLITSLNDTDGFPCPQEFVNVLLFGVQHLNPTHDYRFLSYSNFFVGGKNFENFVSFMYDVMNSKLAQSVILVVNHRARINHQRFMKFAHDVIYVFDDGPNQYERYKELIIAQIVATARAHSGTLFLISAGPLSKIFIYEMWKASKCNQYVDIGSPLDEFSKKVGDLITLESMKKMKKSEYFCNRYKYENGYLWTLSENPSVGEEPELRVKDNQIIEKRK